MSPDGTNLERRHALGEYVIDPASDAAFDRLARLAARSLKAPMATIGFADQDRIWYKTTYGVNIEEHDADFSFCAETMRRGAFFTINNPHEHEQFAEHPLLRRDEPIRFYAGAPLVVNNLLGTSGPTPIGALSILDTQPRELSPSEIETLQDLAAVTVDELDLRATKQRASDVLESITDAFFALDRSWRFTYLNSQAEQLLQRSRSELLGRNVWTEFPEAQDSPFQRQYEKAVRKDVTVRFEAFYEPLNTWFSVRAYPYNEGLSVYFLDITERKRREEQLALLEQTVEQASDAVLVTEAAPLDPPGPKIVYANPAFSRMTGYSVEEIQGQTPRALQGPKTDEDMLADLREHLEAGKPFAGETINYRKDGTPYAVRWSIAPVRNSEGDITHWVSVQHDITERRAMEKALREREERFRLLFQNNPLPMWVYDRETLRFLAVNEAAIDQYGYSEDEFLDMRITDIRPAEDVPRLMDNLSEERPELEQSGPWRHQLQDGRIINVEITSHTIEFDGHDAALVVAQDITDRIAAERALRKREKYLSVTLNSIGDAVITTDVDGHVSRMNAVAETLTGWSSDEAEGRTLEDIFQIVNAQTREPVENPVDEVLRKGHIVGLANHTMLIARDGTERQIADSAAPIRTEEGELLGVVLVFRDVTERYERQQALRESKIALEEAQKITHTGNLVLDVATDTIELSEEAGRILGLDPSQPHKADAFRALIRPEDRPIIEEAGARIRQSGEAYDLEFRIIPSGSEEMRWVRGRGHPIRDEQGNVTKIFGTLTDITERKERESTIQRFGRLLDASVNEIYLFDEDSLEFTQVNQGALENLGYSAEEIQSMTPLDLKPYTRAEFESLLEPLRTGEEELITFETTHRRKDGSTYPVEVRLQLVWQESPPIFVAVILDITERKAAEEALRKSEERFRAVTEQAVDVIAIIDEEARYRYLSPSFEAVTGFTREELMGQNGMARVHPDDQPQAQAALEQAFADPDYTIDENIRYQHRNGEWRHLSVAGRRLTSPSDENEVLLNVRDVTEQRRATERIAALHEIGQAILSATSAREIACAALERVDRLIPNARASVVEFDKTAHEAIVLAVDADYETAFSAERRIPLDDFIDFGELDLNTTHYVAHLTPETAVSDTAQALYDEGIRSYFEVPLVVDDTIIGMLGVGAGEQDAFESTHFDIAREVADMLALALRQARVEDELRAAKEEAEEMNRLKSAFLANMSHEIRTPLTSIIGFAEVLGAQDLGEGDRFITLIRRGGERLLETLNSVLDFSQLEAGSMHLSPAPVNVVEEVHDTADLFVPRAAEEDVDLVLDVPDQPLHAEIDPAALRRILSNLLSNAIKFTEPGDTITTRVEPQDETFILEVEDTGVGIDPDFLPHLFEAFQQESTGDARAYEGSGLGLAISQQLTEMMGGSIDVESTKGEGTCFTVRLPRQMETGDPRMSRLSDL